MPCQQDVQTNTNTNLYMDISAYRFWFVTVLYHPIAASNAGEKTDLSVFLVFLKNQKNQKGRNFGFLVF